VTTLKAGVSSDASAGQIGTLCLSNEGVALLVDVPSGTLQASTYATAVQDNVFALPAPPDHGGQPPPSS